MEFARQEADVVLHYSSSRGGAESAVEEIRATTDRRASLLQADLSKVEDCFRLMDYAADFLGGLDILINKAGITEVWKFMDVTPEQFDLLYNVNIRGQFFCAQRAVKYMRERGGGATRRRSEQRTTPRPLSPDAQSQTS